MNKKTIERGACIRQAMFDGIKQYIRQHGYSPSVREIGDMVGLKSTSSVYSHLHVMFAEGILETYAAPGTARAIRVPGWKFIDAIGDKDA